MLGKKEISIFDFDKMFFKLESLRTICKIVYEWYCENNKIYYYDIKHKKIVDFILMYMNDNKNLIEIVHNNLLQLSMEFQKNYPTGSHILFEYIEGRKKYIVFSFFKIVTYRIFISDIDNDLNNNIQHSKIINTNIFFSDRSKKEGNVFVNYSDLQGIGMTKNFTLATLIAICSASLGKPAISSLAVLGDISISGTILKVDELANVLQVCLDSGVKKVLLPITSAVDMGTVPAGLIGAFNIIFYSTPQEAVFKALGVE